jgi:ElaB/YqjD/DUF883 family membrane-anchored ribosome-binding protein
MLSSLIERVRAIKKAFQNQNANALRGISNQAIREAALQNDSLRAELAVISYALHKLLSKEHVRSDKKWEKIQKSVLKKLEEAIQNLNNKKMGEFEKSLSGIASQIKQTDESLGNYSQNLMEKSRVKQASSLYALGLSLGQATALTNADKKSLFNYIGYTKMSDENPSQKTIVERVKELEKVLE